jgi:hypothetical protein
MDDSSETMAVVSHPTSTHAPPSPPLMHLNSLRDTLSHRGLYPAHRPRVTSSWRCWQNLFSPLSGRDSIVFHRDYCVGATGLLSFKEKQCEGKARRRRAKCSCDERTGGQLLPILKHPPHDSASYLRFSVYFVLAHFVETFIQCQFTLSIVTIINVISFRVANVRPDSEL